MTPMGRAALGLVVVFVDLRIGTFDVLLDPVGWVLALTGLASLVGRHRAFQAGTAAAGVGLALSFFQVLTSPPSGVALAQSVAETIVVFCICTALVALLPGEADRRAAGIIRWLDLGLLGVVVASYLVGPEEPMDPGWWAVPLVLLMIVAVATVVWFLVLLMRVRREPVLQAAGAPGSSLLPSP